MYKRAVSSLVLQLMSAVGSIMAKIDNVQIQHIWFEFWASLVDQSLQIEEIYVACTQQAHLYVAHIFWDQTI